MISKRWIVVFSLLAISVSGISAAQPTQDSSSLSEQFTSQKVEFKKMSRTYAKATGELNNNSGKNYRQADFVIHVYDASGKLISSTPFIIRNFVTGTTREFNTTIKAYVKYISSYKIGFTGGTEIPPTP